MGNIVNDPLESKRAFDETVCATKNSLVCAHNLLSRIGGATVEKWEKTKDGFNVPQKDLLFMTRLESCKRSVESVLDFLRDVFFVPDDEEEE